MITAHARTRLFGYLRDPQQLAKAIDEFFRVARVVIAQDEAERFATATAPDGTPWKPLSPNTLRISVLDAIRKVGGRAARPIVRQTPTGKLMVRARAPQPGFQRAATVRRTRRSRILIDTGRLRNSVVALSANADAIRDRRQLVLLWGTRVPYAARHQFGDPAKNLPARPFLGLSPKATQQLTQQLGTILDRYARRA